jgi:hypothetical protein
MAAPTNAAKREKSSCQPEAVHTWQILLQKSKIEQRLKSRESNI